MVTQDFAALVDKVDKITLVSDDAELLRGLHDKANAAHGAAATIAQSQTYYLDVTALKANKGDGVATLARAFGVSLEEVAVLGDQANDLPMLARAGLPIVMANAPDAVREQISVHTRSNADDGVAYAIDTLILTRIGVPS